MRKDVLLKVADHIEFSSELGLNMCSFQNGCGTTACIAGHIVFLENREHFDKGWVDDIVAIKILCVKSHKEKLNLCKLFFEYSQDVVYDRKRVADVIRHFVETDVVDWTYVKPERIDVFDMTETIGSDEVQTFMKELEQVD